MRRDKSQSLPRIVYRHPAVTGRGVRIGGIPRRPARLADRCVGRAAQTSQQHREPRARVPREVHTTEVVCFWLLRPSAHFFMCRDAGAYSPRGKFHTNPCCRRIQSKERQREGRQDK